MTQAERAELVARTVFAREWEQLAHTARVVKLLADAHPEYPRAGTTDNELAVAWLHDVVEDSHLECADLGDLGFRTLVVDAVELLSRRFTEGGADYAPYKKRLIFASGEPGRLARLVKLCDARDNLDRCERAAGVPKWERLAEDRYRPMIRALEATVSPSVRQVIMGWEGWPDDVRTRLRRWNMDFLLSFYQRGDFICGGCFRSIIGHVNGNAVVRHKRKAHGVQRCESCLVKLARHHENPPDMRDDR